MITITSLRLKLNQICRVAVMSINTQRFIEPFKAHTVIIQKPVNWFEVQITLLVSILW